MLARKTSKEVFILPIYGLVRLLRGYQATSEVVAGSFEDLFDIQAVSVANQ